VRIRVILCDRAGCASGDDSNSKVFPRFLQQQFLDTVSTRSGRSIPSQLLQRRGRDVFERYRSERYAEMGISWTLSKEVAVWFARRWQDKGLPMVVTGKCRKRDVLGYTNGRKEQEIIINPVNIRVVKSLTSFYALERLIVSPGPGSDPVQSKPQSAKHNDFGSTSHNRQSAIYAQCHPRLHPHEQGCKRGRM
jgi:hypothetical protein